MKRAAKVAVIVTVINRTELLRRCLQALKNQTYQDFAVYVVANGASDNAVQEMIAENFPIVNVLSFKEFLGSAGAYKIGLQKAAEDGSHWFWLMDDDVHPEKNALAQLVEVSKLDPSRTYASVDLDEKGTEKLCWYNNIYEDGNLTQVQSYSDLPETAIIESAGIGYMGLFIPKIVLEKAGYPNPKYFIWADDEDFSRRIQHAGFRQYFIRSSIIYHPRARYHEISILGKKGYAILGPPWREYYQIRNTIAVWSTYDGRAKTLLFNMPKQFILWMYVLIRYQDQKFQRFFIYLRAFFDGAFGRLGMSIKPQ